MIIFLYGPDTYRSRRKLDEIIAQHKKTQKSGIDFKRFEGKNLDFQDFSLHFRSFSMFREKKFFILENILSNKNFTENFQKELESFSNSKDIVLFYEDGETPKGKFLEALKKKAKSQEFRALGREALKSWAKKEFALLGAKIEESGLERLISLAGDNSWQIANEIKKLSSFKRNKPIEEEDVNLLVKPQIETDIFSTIDALAQKNKKKALFLARYHMEKGDSPQYLLSMIVFQFRNLLVVKNLLEKNRPFYVLQKESGLHPFVARKSYYLAQKFTFETLKKIYQRLFKVDVDIKTGKIEAETALDLLIAEI